MNLLFPDASHNSLCGEPGERHRLPRCGETIGSVIQTTDGAHREQKKAAPTICRAACQWVFYLLFLAFFVFLSAALRASALLPFPSRFLSLTLLGKGAWTYPM